MQNNLIYFFDLSKDKYIKTSTNDIPKLVNVNSILESVKNILSTKTGERPYRPEFGCDIEELLFEPLDEFTARQLITQLQKCIKDNEPRIEKLEIEIELDYDNNAYIVTLFVTPKSENKEYTFQTLLKTVR